MDNPSLVGTLMSAPSSRGDDLHRLSHEVEWLEIRADLVGDLDVGWIRSHFSGRLLFTLRSTAEGGCFDGSVGDRHRWLLRAASQYDAIDLEGDRDLVPRLLRRVPPAKRLISWTGSSADVGRLRARAHAITSVPAWLYSLSVPAKSSRDGLVPLNLLRTLDRRDVVAYATGEAGFWSRVVAPHFGAPVVFGIANTQEASLGQPTISQLIQDYGFPEPPPLRALYGIVGDPVGHSLSPRLHNAGYRALGLPCLFVPFQEASFDGFWTQMVQNNAIESLGVSLNGLTVVSPHKEAALTAGVSGSAMVQRAFSTNIFTKNGHRWTADTTDPEGTVLALRTRGIPITHQKTAVIGCGGAGRAVAAALDELGANVTLVNRSAARGQQAQMRLGLPFVPLSAFSPDDYSMVVNATPLGRQGEALPFDVRRMRMGGSVIDLAYGRELTPLIRQALALGLTAIDGLEVLRIQVLRQFHLMTNAELPPDLCREELGLPDRELAAAR